jgi:REP element-mobilizing transposase RayT
MPNHIHVLFRVQNVPMSRLVEAWKSHTAKEANKVLRRNGQFWQQDYWDTFIRDEEHELKTRRYIENNPTKAKLVAFRKHWAWSSARFRDSYERLCLRGT